MADQAVYLVPIGSGSYELYTEPTDDVEPGSAPDESSGFWRRTIHRLHQSWREAVHAAHVDSGANARSGRIARARDWLVRRIAESIAEQRTLWSLRSVTSASFVFPADLTEASGTAIRQRLLTEASRHHGRWLVANLAGLAATAILVLLPGPNLIGYYFVFRVVGHFLSWRGARQALDRVSWYSTAEPILSELGSLAHLSREERAERVESLAAQLGLPRLAAFFDRVATPAC